MEWNNAVRSLWWRAQPLAQRAGRPTLVVAAAAILTAGGLLACAAWSGGKAEPSEPLTSAVPVDPMCDLRSAADDADIWQSEAQRTRQWQLAKMTTLSRLLTDFPAIQQATVLIESGTRQGLGRSGTPPQAAVNVRLRDDQSMTLPLMEAIVDLVAASVTGLDRNTVRVIDSRGASYCLADGLPFSPDAAAMAQTHHSQRSAPPSQEGVFDAPAAGSPSTDASSSPSPVGYAWLWMLSVLVTAVTVAVVTGYAVRRAGRRRRRKVWTRLRRIVRRRQAENSAMARIVRDNETQAGRRQVLDALAEQEPLLAEAIRRQLADIDDRGSRPASQQAVASAGAAGRQVLA